MVCNFSILKTRTLLLMSVRLQRFEDSDTFSDSVQLQYFEDSDTFLVMVCNFSIQKTRTILLMSVQLQRFEDSDTFLVMVMVSNFSILKTRTLFKMYMLGYFGVSDYVAYALLVIVQLHHFKDRDAFRDSVQLQHFENSDAFRAFWAILVLLTQAQGKPKSFQS